LARSVGLGSAPRPGGGSPGLLRGDRRSAAGGEGDARSARIRPASRDSERTQPPRRGAGDGQRCVSATAPADPYHAATGEGTRFPQAVSQFAHLSGVASPLSTSGLTGFSTTTQAYVPS